MQQSGVLLQRKCFSSVLAMIFIATGFLSSSVHAALMKTPDSRLLHARELLGRSFQKKVVRKANDGTEVSDFILEATRKFLPKKHKVQSKEIASAIVNASEEYDLDPVFVMAVIQNESSFDPKRVGTSGEIGLMQILPDTAVWISSFSGQEYQGKKSLLDPVMNIWLGAALLGKLRKQFDSEGRLYVSAYNAGATKVRKLVRNQKIPKIYVQAVMKRYIAIYDGFRKKGDLSLRSSEAFQKVMSVTN